jgi:hypothetical protein
MNDDGIYLKQRPFENFCYYFYLSICIDGYYSVNKISSMRPLSVTNKSKLKVDISSIWQHRGRGAWTRVREESTGSVKMKPREKAQRRTGMSEGEGGSTEDVKVKVRETTQGEPE